MIKDYQAAAKSLEKSLKKLDGIVDSLDKARAGGESSKVPPLITSARAEIADCEKQFEAVEKLRQKYWTERAKEAMVRLEAESCPLLEEVLFCWEATANRTLRRTPVQLVQELLASRWSTHTEPAGPVPADPPGLPSELLRADREVYDKLTNAYRRGLI